MYLQLAWKFEHNMNPIDHVKHPDNKDTWPLPKQVRLQPAISSILSSHPFPKGIFLINFARFFFFKLKLSVCTARFSPCCEHCQISHGTHHTAISADVLHERSNWFCLFYAVRITAKEQQPTAQCSLPLPKRHLD